MNFGEKIKKRETTTTKNNAAISQHPDTSRKSYLGKTHRVLSLNVKFHSVIWSAEVSCPGCVLSQPLGLSYANN